MLILGSDLKKLAVMSLQTGGELATTREAIVNPRRLQVIAYRVEGLMVNDKNTYLRTDDARELSDIGFIIDSIDDFVKYGDVIKLDEIIDTNFKLDGIKVIDQKKRNLGKVTDYTVNVDDFTVQQLVVKRPIFRRLGDTELLIHRSNIVNITNQAITIRSEVETPEHTATNTPGSYINPFRDQSRKAVESVDIINR